MLYKVLLTIGSFIILVFLITTYFLSLKKTNKITYRQRMYMILRLMELCQLQKGIFMDLMHILLMDGIRQKVAAQI